MADYSNTTSAAGFTINSTLNSEADTVTIVVTAPNGTTATVTAARGDFDAAQANLSAQLTAAGSPITRGAYGAIRSSIQNVFNQQDKAEKAARATNTPVPDAPAPPPSTNNAADPAVAPAPNNTPPVQNPKPATVTPPVVDELSAFPPNTVPQQSTEIDEESAYPENPVGQLPSGVDEESAYPPATVAQRSTEIDEESAYPPNTVAQRSTEIDEDSAYPPNPVDVAAKAQLLAGVGRTSPGEALKGLTGQQLNTNSQATQQDESNFAGKDDWRVRLSLAPGASYLYKNANPGILAPLAATNGVIFPYTPAISVAYNASYDPTDLTHSNYKYFTYRGSAVDSISLGCEFTAQDTTEAEYLLAVIHFFRSVTKMFYGQDRSPIAGTPPPLCYLTGLGTFQFDQHPLVITSFTYTLPVDVDYISAGSSTTAAGVNTAPGQSKGSPNLDAGSSRRDAAGINTGAVASPPNFTSNTGSNTGSKEPTYVPTKMQITIGAVPIVTRADISNEFSLKKYATGELLRGSKRKGGGIW